jgi:hypothetical protein
MERHVQRLHDGLSKLPSYRPATWPAVQVSFSRFYRLMLAILGLSSCQPRRPSIVGSIPAGPSPADLIAAMRARYSSMRSYDDEGVVAVVFNVPPTRPRYAKFRTHYDKPRLVFQYELTPRVDDPSLGTTYRLIMESNGNGTVAIHGSTGDEVEESLKGATHVLSGVSDGTARMVPAFLTGGPDILDDLASLAGARVLRSEMIELLDPGWTHETTYNQENSNKTVVCFRIELPPQVGGVSTTMWIDEHHVIRRIVQTSSLSTHVISYQMVKTVP